MPFWSHANGKTSAQVEEKFLTGEESTELWIAQWGSAHMQAVGGAGRTMLWFWSSRQGTALSLLVL